MIARLNSGKPITRPHAGLAAKGAEIVTLPVRTSAVGRGEPVGGPPDDRRHVRPDPDPPPGRLERLATNNEIAGFKFATVGVIYAVLLAFAVIVVWEKFTEAETAVVQEAGAAATLYRLASGPEPEAVATRAALTNYLRLAIDRDWPQMAAEKESHG